MKVNKLFIPFFFSLSLFAADELQKSGEQEFIDFSKIQSILKNDKLELEAQKKVVAEQNKKKMAEKKLVAKYDFPSEEEFFQFISEVWLIKNAQLLKWDIDKPDYGLKEYYKSFLEKLGIYNHKFRILLVDTPTVTHFVLPSDKNEAIYLVSVPFIRQLDLSKQEISIMMLEDYFRLQKGHFKKRVSLEKVGKYFSKNFYPNLVTKSDLDPILKEYSTFIFEKGFTFDEQFEVTTTLSSLLKSNLALWNVYLGLLKKIDDLVKLNTLYKRHSSLYPSPELQIEWLVPKKDR